MKQKQLNIEIEDSDNSPLTVPATYTPQLNHLEIYINPNHWLEEIWRKGYELNDLIPTEYWDTDIEEAENTAPEIATHANNHITEKLFTTQSRNTTTEEQNLEYSETIEIRGHHPTISITWTEKYNRITPEEILQQWHQYND